MTPAPPPHLVGCTVPQPDDASADHPVPRFALALIVGEGVASYRDVAAVNTVTPSPALATLPTWGERRNTGRPATLPTAPAARRRARSQGRAG